jgi:hypothetical protein
MTMRWEMQGNTVYGEQRHTGEFGKQQEVVRARNRSCEDGFARRLPGVSGEAEGNRTRTNETN